MRALITGVAGFIGSNLADYLLEQGHIVVGIDNLSTGQLNFIKHLSPNSNFSFFEVDLVTSNDLSNIFAGADIVFHLAANADIRDGLNHPFKDLEQNTISTFNVLEAMRAVDIKRIVFSSTAAALGEPEIFPTPESCPIPTQTSLYGASKMACEGLISSYCEGFGFEGYVFRFVSILGPRYPHGHVFDFVKQLLENKDKLVILGDGTQRKSYLHVSDCVRALIKIGDDIRTAKNAKHHFQIYHLGVEDYCRVSQSAGWIIDELKLSPEIIYTGGNKGWIGDNPFVFLDVKKAIATGWNPEFGIEESIRETVRWLVSNQWIFNRRV
ncbi:NAD-dependent epimerase/dehydratase family protein [Polynucleobacter sphagniphilus]|uniref:NAD-dependent epimerase/dehydratase family protein n=1 Tax=Polynucleobacter sphagniphilus TaxID=1743169 RepID=UPI002404A43E|nr:NAD-dependent epimerase/dehydratase family protein [Polynucleobacter sphagniphilus]MDF9787848.1 UDP-glucose 4-epimerase [Polynucleobacter sphagniphilus]